MALDNLLVLVMTLAGSNQQQVVFAVFCPDMNMQFCVEEHAALLTTRLAVTDMIIAIFLPVLGDVEGQLRECPRFETTRLQSPAMNWLAIRLADA